MLDIKSTFIDLANDDRFIKDVREITLTKLVQENVDTFFTVVPGIKGGQQIAAAKGIEYVTKADEGCGASSLTPDIPAISQKWNPRLAKVRIKYCYTDFMGKFTQWGLANGYKIKDLNEANFADFLEEIVYDAMRMDILRIVLMGDEDIAAQNILADPNKAPFYDLIEKGLIPTLQYFKTVPELQDNFIDLDKNAGTDQFDLDNDYARKLYEAVVDADDFDGNITITSNKLFKNYRAFIKDGINPLESSKTQIQGGLGNVKIDGELLYPVKNYDRWRKNDFVKAGHTHLPHFVLHTKKEHLQVGVDDKSALEDLTFEYIGGDDEHFYIKANYMIDFKMTNPYEFKAAL